MTDPYRIAESPGTAPDRTAEASTTGPGKPGGLLRPLLWLVLFVSAAANVALSTAVDNPWAGSACGLVAVLCAVALIVQHRRGR